MKNRSVTIFGLLGLVAAVIGFIALTATTRWAWYWSWLLAASVVAFAFYGYDKLAAKAGLRRIPELILHLTTLAGGFSGALLGMLAFRHKSNFRAHPIFLPIIFLGFAVWGLLIYWLHFR